MGTVLPYCYSTDCESCFFTLIILSSFPPNLLPIYCQTLSPILRLHRNPLGLSISKRDSLLEKCAMFREAGGALSRQPSQDNGLDGPFSSGASKLEQVPCYSFLQLPYCKKHSKAVRARAVGSNFGSQILIE